MYLAFHVPCQMSKVMAVDKTLFNYDVQEVYFTFPVFQNFRQEQHRRCWRSKIIIISCKPEHHPIHFAVRSVEQNFNALNPLSQGERLRT